MCRNGGSWNDPNNTICNGRKERFCGLGSTFDLVLRQCGGGAAAVRGRRRCANVKTCVMINFETMDRIRVTNTRS